MRVRQRLLHHGTVPRSSVRVKAATTAGFVLGGVLLGAPSAPAALSGFDGSASASGARLVLFADKAPATKTPIDGGGPVAQAVLDSIGTSSALASNPYPGDVFLAGPGLLAGAFGVPSLPAGYPFIARADHPVAPEQSTSTPMGAFKATANPQQAAAAATSGGGTGDFQIGHAQSQASVRIDGDRVISESGSVARAIQVGDLRIAGMHSTARVTLLPDGTLERVSEVSFDQATVAGLPVTITPSGVVPAPGVAAPPGFSPADQMGDAGIEIVQLNKEDTPDGVVSGALQITKSGDFGPAGPGYIRLIIGQSTARARGEATVLATPAGPAPSGGALPGTAPPTPVPTDAPSEAPPEALPAIDRLDTPVPDAVVESRVATYPMTGETSTAGAGATDGSATSPSDAVQGNDAGMANPMSERLAALSSTAPMQARLAVSESNRLDLTPLYGLLVLAAAAAGASIQLVRFLAEKGR